MDRVKKLESMKPCRLIIGYDKDGLFSSILCESKEDMVEGMKRFEGFRVFLLRESEYEMDWWKNKVMLFEKRKKKLQEEKELRGDRGS